jgi:hypothetical protein
MAFNPVGIAIYGRFNQYRQLGHVWPDFTLG